jgi:hypothetical protein
MALAVATADDVSNEVTMSAAGTFETSRRTVMMSVYGGERKSSVRGQIDAKTYPKQTAEGESSV